MSAKLLVPLIAFVLCFPSSLELRAQTSSKTPDPFLQGNPFTYEQLLESVGPLPHRRLISAITARKVDFAVSEAQREALTKAGATKEILEAIQKSFAPRETHVSAVPSTQTPVVAKKTSRLQVECQPAECSIFIDGKPLGFTSNGRLSLAEIAHHSVLLSIRKEGFITQEFTENFEPGERTVRQVKLVPDEKYLSEEGERILTSVVQALGGSSGLAAASSLTATGEVSIFTQNGQPSRWTAVIRYMAPDSVYFRLKGAGTDIQSSITAKGYKANKGLEKSPLAPEIDADIRLYREYQLPTLIGRIRREKFRVMSTEDRRGFVARSATDNYTFKLGATLLPESVTYSSAAGLGSGLEAIYSNYSDEKDLKIPRTIVIKRPDVPRHGMEVRLTSFSPSAKLSDRDFR